MLDKKYQITFALIISSLCLVYVVGEGVAILLLLLDLLWAALWLMEKPKIKDKELTKLDPLRIILALGLILFLFSLKSIYWQSISLSELIILIPIMFLCSARTKAEGA